MSRELRRVVWGTEVYLRHWKKKKRRQDQKMSKPMNQGAWVAQSSVPHMTPDLRVVSSSPTLGAKLTKINTHTTKPKPMNRTPSG